MPQVKLEGRSFIEFLNHLERQADPGRMRTPEFNYWPIVRFAINYRRKTGRGYIERKSGLGHSIPWSTILKFRHKEGFILEWQNLNENARIKFEKCDVLFLARKPQYTRIGKGIVSQMLVDGLRKITENPNIISVSYSIEDARENGEQYLLETLTLPKPHPFRPRQYLQPRDCYEYFLHKSVLRNLEKVNKLIRGVGPQMEVNPYEILYRIEITTQHYYHWLAILKEMSPKVVFMSSFSGMHYACAAARKLGIRVVDIQHGGMNPYHPIAANWRHIPKQGYELLPDIFWCWSLRSASYIKFPSCTPHKAVVGGNPRAALEYLQSPDLGDARPAATGKRRILVALQYGAEPLLLPHVQDIYLAYKERFDWIFRLHPTGWDRTDEAVTKLGLDRAQLERDSRVPLHIQLPQIDLVLTNASTIVFEARDYGAKAAVCSPIGAAIFDALISEGEVLLANTAEQLTSVLSELEVRRQSAPTAQVSVAGVATENLDLVRKQYAEILAGVGLQ